MTLFAEPDISALTGGDGTVSLRSGQPLRGCPVTVVHSVRAAGEQGDAGQAR